MKKHVSGNDKKRSALGRTLAPSMAVALLAGFVAAEPALASGVGFIGPGPEIITVEQAASRRDDAQVALRGNIIRNLGGEEYLFRDDTGEIILEISSRDWNGQQISPQDTVEIYGEIDKDWTSVEVEVDRVIKK